MLLSGFMLVWPLLAIGDWHFARRAVRRSETRDESRYGAIYEADARGLRYNGKWVALWKHAIAWRLLPTPDETTSLQLLRRNGLHSIVCLPADLSERERVVEGFGRYVPEYESSVHGLIDDNAHVPSWVPLSFAGVGLGGAACLLLLSPAIARIIGKPNGEMWGPLVLLMSFLVPLVIGVSWYTVVRRTFNPIQRVKIFGYVVATIAFLWVGYIAVLAWASFRDALPVIQSVPADVYTEMSKTVTGSRRSR